MWLDEYNELNNGERERFARLVNYLLSKTYLTRETYEGKQVIYKVNPDYRFLERYVSLFEGYLAVINYTLTIDEDLGVAYIKNEYGYNKMHLDKLTTILLFTLRTIYDEEREKSASKGIVYISTASLIYRLLELKVVSKKPTMKDISDSIRLLVNQNILAKISGSIDESSCELAILPTIILAVSNEKIDAIYSMVFQADKLAETAPRYANQEIDDSVFNNLDDESSIKEVA